MLSISLVTLGDPGQLTGGYLYHRRMADDAVNHDAAVRFVSFPAAPFPTPALWGRHVWRHATDAADVVLVDSIAAAFLGPWRRFARRDPAVPLVAIVHQPPGGIDYGPVRAAPQAVLDRMLYRAAARIIAASEALARDYEAQGFDAQKIVVVPPGRDVAPSQPGVTGVPRLDLRAGRRAALLCVGNWVERKGILPLLEAFATLPGNGATLHLVGRDDVEPAYAARVRARLANDDLTGRVTVHGPVARERVAELYAAADVFVLASTKEPYGTVYGEAMAAGLPVVGWRSGNLPHLASDGTEGVAVEPGDVAALAAALRRLVEDDAYRQQLAAAARTKAESFPTWAESAARLFGVLREVAAGGKA
ncbi:MAG TPA: glycosyltransferase family 4 protein [Acidimicrobiia bacterium]|nr:glycosyltransferase family 4 protein [Acidimicrobiia bacterium]